MQLRGRGFTALTGHSPSPRGSQAGRSNQPVTSTVKGRENRCPCACDQLSLSPLLYNLGHKPRDSVAHSGRVLPPQEESRRPAWSRQSLRRLSSQVTILFQVDKTKHHALPHRLLPAHSSGKRGSRKRWETASGECIVLLTFKTSSSLCVRAWYLGRGMPYRHRARSMRQSENLLESFSSSTSTWFWRSNSGRQVSEVSAFT